MAIISICGISRIGAALVLMTAAACTTITAGPELSRLRGAEPVGSEFSQALAQEYLNLANFEADEMIDWRDAQRFTRKGLIAVRGEPVGPENPDDWRLPQEHRLTLLIARSQIDVAFESGAREILPKVAATAQASLDCWIEQQEENWQDDHIAACRQGFETAVLKLDQAITEHRAKQAAREIVLPDPVVITFAFNSYLLNGVAIAQMGVAARIQESENYSIVVTGHADRAGSDEFNWNLSLDRAEATLGVLIAHGINRARILIVAAGETNPVVDTDDGVREPLNRRVVLEFQPAVRNLAAVQTFFTTLN
jgi:OOP family OmpA-OmpF porin